MKLILMGTPDFVRPIFDKLAEAHEIIAVFTRAPKPVGRKQVLTKSSVHIWAEEKNIPVYTDINEIEKLPRPDYIVVVAYGVILKQNVLDFATCINVHYSLLPAYRGAHPVAAAIMNGDKESGVCLQKMALGLDEGDLYSCEKFPILENETTEEIRIKASGIAAGMLVKLLADPSAYPLAPQLGKPTYARKEIGENIIIDWKKTPQQIHDSIRAIGGKTKINGIDVRIIKTKIINGKLEIELVRPAGKNIMSWTDFMNGQRGKCEFL
ncbi:MAG: methionyl-tRNA formyltransferase [Alphaproteobacteria bacterium]|nr:methionyl-tRNA formyltransferase [Alphaproteobacteria bacterium]